MSMLNTSIPVKFCPWFLILVTCTTLSICVVHVELGSVVFNVIVQATSSDAECLYIILVLVTLHSFRMILYNRNMLCPR